MTNREFEKIYRKYRGYAIRIASLILHNRNEAEDICQDVFETVYSMGDEVDFSDEAKLGGLIKTMTFNKTMDYYKKGYRKYECAGSDKLEEFTKAESHLTGANAEDWVLALEANVYMNSVFEKLRKENPTNYEIYVNVKISNISPRSVAEKFNMSENSINNRIMRTKRWLMKEYNKMLDQKE